MATLESRHNSEGPLTCSADWVKQMGPRRKEWLNQAKHGRTCICICILLNFHVWTIYIYIHYVIYVYIYICMYVVYIYIYMYLSHIQISKQQLVSSHGGSVFFNSRTSVFDSYHQEVCRKIMWENNVGKSRLNWRVPSNPKTIYGTLQSEQKNM